MPVLNANKLIDNRVQALRDYHREAGVQKAELDISGGIDSAVMACLLVEALGPENVILVHSRFSTSSIQSYRAEQLALALGCPMIDFWGGDTWTVLMRDMKDAIRTAYGPEVEAEVEARSAADPTILGSIRSCLRAPIGRGFNRLMGGGIRHGTGNECEDRFLRFFQKGGDGEVDTNPIEMLSKTEVYQLAFALGQKWGGRVQEILTDTTNATPSPDLWGVGDGHSDEAEMFSWLGVPFNYGRIDAKTGKVTRIGTIERVSRFLDCYADSMMTWGDVLFGDTEPPWELTTSYARNLKLFPGFTVALIEAFLKAARKAERVTRHKSNATIPTLGSRMTLMDEGILSNDLTDYTMEG